jgi:hypothetical protein
MNVLSPNNQSLMISSFLSSLDRNSRDDASLNAKALELLICRERFRRSRHQKPREAKNLTGCLELLLGHLCVGVPSRFGFGQCINDSCAGVGHIRDCNSFSGLGFLHDLGQDII